VKLQSTIKIRPDFLYLAPLLNVVMLLMVFFMLNSNFVVRSGERVELPVSTSSLPRGWGAAHAVTITAGEVPRVFLNAEEIPPGELTARLLSLKEEDTNRKVLISADSRTPHGVLMRVQQAIFDAGCEAGIAADSARE
jgi:biopolymer transport protein ExbD